MKRFRDLFVGLICIFAIFGGSTVLAGASDGDKMIMRMPYETMGQRNWFATPTGTGDCSSWNHACTFQAAVAKCTSTVLDMVYVGAGDHDLDNGVDANGTTIVASHVHVRGVCDSFTGGVRLVNGDAAAVYVLRSTAVGSTVENILFDNTGEVDENVIFLDLQESRCLVQQSVFRQTGAPGGGTGIVLSNSKNNCKLRDLQFENITDKAIQINGYDYVSSENIQIDGGGIGISIEGATDSYADFYKTKIQNMTTGVSITGATVTHNMFRTVYFTHNTRNVLDVTAYDDTHWQDVEIGHVDAFVLPADAGVEVATGDGAWVWTAAAVQIVAPDVINNPFYVTQINLQDYDASQTYKIELFWGEAAADNSMGIYEFTTGAAVQGFFMPIKNEVVKTGTPATSGIWAKAKSSTAGIDNATFTISGVEF